MGRACTGSATARACAGSAAGAMMETACQGMSAAALGVFVGFQIFNFNVFLCHNISFAVSGYCFWLLLCMRSRRTIDARQRHSP